MKRPTNRRVTDDARLTSFLVFVEGLRTEPILLNYWARKHRDRVMLKIDQSKGTPATLVNLAVEAKTQAERESARGRGPAYDRVWCVFDVDEHPGVPGAIKRAADYGIEVAVSNPCIELWFLLHGGDQRAAIDCRDAQRRCREKFGFEKTPTSKQLDMFDSSFVDAMRRAKDLDEKHRLDGSPPGSNPSSSIWRLLEMIRTA